MTAEPTITFRVDEANRGHVTLSVFVGRTPGARGHAGRLVLRTDEFTDLLAPSIVTRILGGDQLTLRGGVRFTGGEQIATVRTAIERRDET